jgi:hypothetical protein
MSWRCDLCEISLVRVFFIKKHLKVKKNVTGKLLLICINYCVEMRPNLLKKHIKFLKIHFFINLSYVKHEISFIQILY